MLSYRGATSPLGGPLKCGKSELRDAVNIKYTADFKDFTPTKIMENNLNFILLYVERIMCVY